MRVSYFYIILFVLTASCKKFVATPIPNTQLTAHTVFASDQTAIAAQLSIYARMESDGLAYQQIIYPGLSADEMSNYSTGNFSVDLANNNLTADNAIILTLWTNYYKYIYQANAVLEGIAQSTSISTATKNVLKGEAKFVRAFCYFYLSNLFGEAPLAQSTDFRINAILSRSAVADVQRFIETDLLDAVSSLPPGYLDGLNGNSTERVRPNKYAAEALLAKLYLWMGEWNKAELAASDVLAANYQLLPNLDQVFLKNSGEAIWQWQSVVPNYNSYPGALLILTTTPSVVALDTTFVKGIAATDKRKQQWIKSITVGGKTYYYPYKYKVRQNAASISEYSMVLRVAEQYLIRAEARLKQNNLSGAEQDLNSIRTRAGLTGLSGLSGPALYDSIQKERRVELLAEFGDRWLNLKRTGTVDAVLPSVKGNNWNVTDALYPIPQSELFKNPHLTQNPGY